MAPWLVRQRFGDTSLNRLQSVRYSGASRHNDTTADSIRDPRHYSMEDQATTHKVFVYFFGLWYNTSSLLLCSYSVLGVCLSKFLTGSEHLDIAMNYLDI